jgi:hypothetical protein
MGTGRTVGAGVTGQVAITFGKRHTVSNYFFDGELSGSKKNGQKQDKQLMHVLIYELKGKENTNIKDRSFFYFYNMVFVCGITSRKELDQLPNLAIALHGKLHHFISFVCIIAVKHLH